MKKSIIALSIATAISVPAFADYNAINPIEQPVTRDDVNNAVKELEDRGYEYNSNTGKIIDKTGKTVGALKVDVENPDSVKVAIYKDHDRNDGKDLEVDSVIEVKGNQSNNVEINDVTDRETGSNDDYHRNGEEIKVPDFDEVNKDDKDYQGGKATGDQIDITKNRDAIEKIRKEIKEKAEEDKKAADEAAKAVDEAAKAVDKAAGEAAKVIDKEYARINDTIASNSSRISENSSRIFENTNRINKNEGKMSNGIAGVAAMANIPTVSGRFTLGAGVGSFNGSTAFAVGASNSFDNGISIKGSVSYAQGKFSQKDVVVGAGIGYSF